MKTLEKLSFSELLDLLINEETTDLEKQRVKKFALENFSESPQNAYNKAMEDLKSIPDGNLEIVNSMLCARDMADHLLKNMNQMSFEIIADLTAEKISAGKGHCIRH